MTTMETFLCFGLEFLGKCSYNPHAPQWHVITLGETIASVSLIIALSQLLTPVKERKLKKIFPNVYWFWGVATLFILIASLVPLSPLDGIPVIGFPIFWELLGAILLIVGVTTVVISIYSKLNFNAKDADLVLELAERIIATGSEKDLAELALLLREVLPDLVFHAAQYDTIKAELLRRESKTYNPPTLTVKANNVFKLCTDESFCSVVVSKEPAFAIILIQSIKKYNSSNHSVKQIVRELVKQAFKNKNSILYREGQFKGLGTLSGFTKEMFSDQELNERISPLAFVETHDGETFYLQAIKRFGEVLGYSIRSFSDFEDFPFNSISIRLPMKNLIETAESAGYKLDDHNSDRIYQSESFKALRKISAAIEDILRTLIENEQLSNQEFISSTSGLDDQLSIYENVASWIYGFLGALSHTRKHDAALRDLLFPVWFKIYSGFGITEESLFQKEVQKILERKVNAGLTENFERGLYPAISRPLLALYGLFRESVLNSSYLIHKSSVLNYVSGHFKKSYKADPETAKAMLPAGMSYMEDLEKIKQTMWRRDEVYLDVK